MWEAFLGSICGRYFWKVFLLHPVFILNAKLYPSGKIEKSLVVINDVVSVSNMIFVNKDKVKITV